jgi:hypothetical protein
MEYLFNGDRHPLLNKKGARLPWHPFFCLPIPEPVWGFVLDHFCGPSFQNFGASGFLYIYQHDPGLWSGLFERIGLDFIAAKPP